MVKTAVEVRERLSTMGYPSSLINARFVKPIDENAVAYAARNHRLVVTMEENVASGGYGEKVRAYLDSLHTQCRMLQVAIPDEYVEHGNVEQLKKEIGIDAAGIADRIGTAYERTIGHITG